ncbi:nuclear transport factor 2 family protein [Baekduia soli]|uniref:Nuclear transport factor 2 family protein n=1 Tax=Baekduia soli TaxID=496014 RepID=A0A5B8U8I3_9ACTN|nr:nuclear transport factor 2 family protein [Baekduia soli]QEC49426.1 nuclear transport factor 2 family protein [Baekduia soli]
MIEPTRPVPGWSAAAGRTGLAPPRAIARPDPLLDRLLIAESIARYGWAYDERRLDTMLEGFTEDALWEGSIMGVESIGPFRGRAALREFFGGIARRQTPQRRHAFTNIVVDELGPDTATAHAYILLWSSQDARTTPVTAGPYRFVFVRQDGRWLISELHAGFDAPLDWDRLGD